MKLVEPSWLGVEIRHLSALEAVASERSFSRAARKLGYTQSAISGQIAALERAVGERLLERGVGQTDASPTHAGNLLLNYAHTITARLRAAEGDLAAIRENRRATLRVGIYQSVGATIVPEIVDRLRNEAPEVKLGFYEAGNERNLAHLVEAGELDLSFDVPGPRSPALHVAELLSDPFVIVLSEEASGRPDLASRPVAAFTACAAQAAAEDALRAWGLDPDRVIRLEDARAVLTLVAEGACSALLPRLAVGETALPVRELPRTMPRRTVLLVWHRYRTVPAATEQFVDIVREVSARYAAAA